MGEGIVMASDSRTTYNRTLSAPKCTIHENGVHFADSTYKTFLTPKGVGISTCGQASINGKPIAGFIEEFINLCKDDNIEIIKDKIIPFFHNLDSNINTNFILGGYQIDTDGSYQQKIYHLKTKTNEIIPYDTSTQGALWDGEIDILSRVLTSVYQYDKDNDNYFPLPEYNVPFSHFTIQDAIDFAKYGIQTTIDTMKFQERVKTVGGNIDILIIKPDNSFWIARKELHN